MPSASISALPMMLLIGVRSSWLTVETKSSLARSRSLSRETTSRSRRSAFTRISWLRRVSVMSLATNR